MKIFFCANYQSLSMGSYRIWVDNLNHYFHKCGIESTIGHSINQIGEHHDVVIFGKNNLGPIPKVKQKFPNKKIGVINPAADKKINTDFVIAGSVEEVDSLSHHKNVFLYPLIEKMYQNAGYKTHSHRDKLRIGFHGHYPHLAKFEPHLREALEKFNKFRKIELLVITGDPNFNWQHGRPKNIKIINRAWDLNTIEKNLLSCDIGIVPNITHTTNVGDTNDNFWLYNTDYILRLKNKSNAGRCFVFHQLGIPVIADFTPSNFHILGDPRNGLIAQNKDGWLKALMKLRKYKHRQEIADNAKKEFDRLYNPEDWARRLYKSIEGI